MQASDLKGADMKGLVVLVTGATRGLGRSMVQAFAEAGADIAIVSRKQSACDATAAEIAALGVRTFAYACHMGHWDEIEPMVEAVYQALGKVDVLVNNAGMSPLYPSLGEVSEDMFDKVIGVNFKGPFRLTALVGERMQRAGSGSVINISSTASYDFPATALPYGGAKAALNGLTQGFAAAYSPQVRVNCIVVGPFATDVAEHWPDSPDPANPGFTQSGMRVGLPEEIVGAAMYFATDASSYTSGALLRVDGGPRSTKSPAR
ncbi:MAG: NAD(P)-dependent dehydrogenase (short-subunit alcohol dehydrogenase family) [Candidatus Pseudothioglobus sp.]|jgi:NAD(P)-dependent dehydrogenase (short-subunit alcohol dehydrogenase family)